MPVDSRSADSGGAGKEFGHGLEPADRCLLTNRHAHSFAVEGSDSDTGSGAGGGKSGGLRSEPKPEEVPARFRDGEAEFGQRTAKAVAFGSYAADALANLVGSAQ